MSQHLNPTHCHYYVTGSTQRLNMEVRQNINYRELFHLSCMPVQFKFSLAFSSTEASHPGHGILK